MKTHPRQLLALALVVVALPASASNLVPNPSFEDYSPCPKGPGQINRVDLWTSPNTASPDYFNECENTGFNFVDVPDNQLGSEPAAEGVAYAGIAVADNGSMPDFREYLQIQLVAPLVPGKQYDVSYFVSLADGAETAVSNLDAYFQTGPVSQSDQENIDVTPQVTNPLGVITQTDGWVQIRGSFTATGPWDHLIIGNFLDDTLTIPLTVVPPGTSSSPSFAYYYVDSVSVFESCPANATVLEFDSKLVSGSGIGTFAGTHLEDGFEVLNSFPILAYGDQHPFYTGSAAIMADHPWFIIQRVGGGTFDACSLAIAETDGPFPNVAFMSSTGGAAPTQAEVVNPPSPFPETVVLGGFEDIDQLYINDVPLAEKLVQFDDVCLCLPGDCVCPPVIDAQRSPGRYCVFGKSNAQSWSWQFNSESIFDVDGVLPIGAPASKLVEAFVESINTNTGASAVRDPLQPECFTIAYTPGFVLKVGPEAQAPTCTITGVSTGCTFNPVIMDAAFLPPPPGTVDVAGPPPVPVLSPVSLVWTAGMIAVLAWMTIRWRRRRA